MKKTGGKFENSEGGYIRLQDNQQGGSRNCGTTEATPDYGQRTTEGKAGSRLTAFLYFLRTTDNRLRTTKGKAGSRLMAQSSQLTAQNIITLLHYILRTTDNRQQTTVERQPAHCSLLKSHNSLPKILQHYNITKRARLFFLWKMKKNV